MFLWGSSVVPYHLLCLAPDHKMWSQARLAEMLTSVVVFTKMTLIIDWDNFGITCDEQYSFVSSDKPISPFSPLYLA